MFILDCIGNVRHVEAAWKSTTTQSMADAAKSMSIGRICSRRRRRWTNRWILESIELLADLNIFPLIHIALVRQFAMVEEPKSEQHQNDCQLQPFTNRYRNFHGAADYA